MILYNRQQHLTIENPSKDDLRTVIQFMVAEGHQLSYLQGVLLLFIKEPSVKVKLSTDTFKCLSACSQMVLLYCMIMLEPMQPMRFGHKKWDVLPSCNFPAFGLRNHCLRFNSDSDSCKQRQEFYHQEIYRLVQPWNSCFNVNGYFLRFVE